MPTGSFQQLSANSNSKSLKKLKAGARKSSIIEGKKITKALQKQISIETFFQKGSPSQNQQQLFCCRGRGSSVGRSPFLKILAQALYSEVKGSKQLPIMQAATFTMIRSAIKQQE